MDHTVRLVLVFIGDDTPGLVFSLAEVVADHGGNWEFGRMSARGGVFAGVLEVTVARDRAEALIEDFSGLHGIVDVLVRTGTAHEPVAPTTYLLDVRGTDRPGIVEAVAAAVARPQINVRRFASESVRQDGVDVFTVRAVLAPTEEVDLDTFLEGLRAACASVDAHVELSPAV